MESHITLPYDGNLIGAYVQDIGRGRVRISDNADTLFHAMSVGVAPSSGRGKRLATLATEHFVQLSESGELFVACDIKEAPFYLARFLEAAASISNACNQWHTVAESKFEGVIRRALGASFPRQVKRGFQVRGASGHQLKFPFALDAESSSPQVIQPISAQGDHPFWPSVYHALGKMIDLKNAVPSIRRVVVMEATNELEISKAATALAECASVIVFSTPEKLARALKAA
ncbi:DUF1828 domain-containing protein [Metapseudomonas otitidis]|uniref:DUF1828 domain-containing protein n=1 Tax=Metapseudomonas otitidis TaxID=319939 RepID=UPI0013F65C6A|nr:DUF1828 domain-containing protein [Pseudomonas otitidis]